MNELDKQLSPEDFEVFNKGGELNIWRPFVEKFGPEPMQWLMDQAWTEMKYTSRVNIPNPLRLKRKIYDRITLPS